MKTCHAQGRLEECLKKQEEIQKALEVTKQETEKERERSDKERVEWEQEREAMKEEISELRDNMRENCETLKKMEGKHEVHKGYLQNTLNVIKEFGLKVHTCCFSSLHNNGRS